MTYPWKTIKGIGKLYFVADLVYGNEEVLFVCQSRMGNLYLIETYDSWEEQYIIAETDIDTLEKMIDNKLTIKEAFKKSDKIYVTELTKNKLVAHKFQSFPSDMLPKDGIYLNSTQSTMQILQITNARNSLEGK